VKFLDGDRRSLLGGQLGDGLADIAVTVDHLVHRVSLVEQLLAVQGSGAAVFRRARVLGPGSGRFRVAQRLDELAEEQGYAMLQLCFSHGRRVPLAHLRATASDQLVAVRGQEFVQHFISLQVQRQRRFAAAAA
jgi:hypothetical protein